MRILFYTSDTANEQAWLADLQAALPHAEIECWQADASFQPADYAVAWKPPRAMLQQHPELKALFNLGAGVDAILQLDVLPDHLPLIRIDDGGMAIQMAEFATEATLRYFRRLDQYALQAQQGLWQPLAPYDKADFGIGVLGLGVLGQRICSSLQHFGFHVSGWSRQPKEIDGVTTYAGMHQLEDFLRSSRVLICMLPLTVETTGILNAHTLSLLPHGAYLINLARGAHLVEADLPALLDSGQIAGATLDVFEQEPLAPTHAFWRDQRITVTPHISALTIRDAAAQQIAVKIAALERGEPVAGIVDRHRGY